MWFITMCGSEGGTIPNVRTVHVIVFDITSTLTMISHMRHEIDYDTSNPAMETWYPYFVRPTGTNDMYMTLTTT